MLLIARTTVVYSTATHVDTCTSFDDFSPDGDAILQLGNADFFSHSAELVDRIRQGETESIEILCAVLKGAARSQLVRKVDRQLVEDKFHDVIVTVLEAISNGSLRHPDRLLGFVRTVTRRSVAAHIRANIKRRRCTLFDECDFPGTDETSPEAMISKREELEYLGTLLNVLRPRDRNLLIRFYFNEQQPSEICKEMGLTATQFRLYKSQALARCATTADPAPPEPRPMRQAGQKRKLTAA
jgi:RNA polymerase sigma-70 factor, ECF subfamily